MAWTCQRVQAGVKCGHVNPNRLRKCERCLKLRRPRKQPAHRAVLKDPYDLWAERFGARCGICGRLPTARRKLDRDHDHRTGRMRGLLCARCNRALPNWVTPQWLRMAAAYLEVAAADSTSYARGVPDSNQRTR